MFVLFEGIDGSGKTTLSNRVAEALAAGGLRVVHTRQGGRFASTVTQAIRELGRDARNMMMTPHAELMLYAARDLQLLQEATLPALARADVVIADRFLYSAEVLARWGRGLPPEDVEPVLRAATRGVTPDLVFLVDVDPHVARARRRVAKIVAPDPRPSSRKGLAGVGMQQRLREGYRALAARAPDRWAVVDNTDADLDALVGAVAEAVRAARRDGPAAGVAAMAAATARARETTAAVTPLHDAAEALARFVAWIDRRAAREPALAAYFLAGLWGDPLDARREALAERAPEVTANGLRGLDDETSWRLRRRLHERVPGLVARSLVEAAAARAEAQALLQALAERCPLDVAAALDGRDDEPAWALRERLWDSANAAAGAPLRARLAASLGYLSGERAWELRARWLAEAAAAAALDTYEGARAACASVAGLDDGRAWDLRKQARDVAPVPALDSVAGLTGERAWKWRRRALDRAAKVVMRTIDGVDDPRAWELRTEVALHCKEALDSIVGLDGPPAWALREACADVWPSTVVKSLGPLVAAPRGRTLLARQLGRHAGNLSLLKHAAAAALRHGAVE